MEANIITVIVVIVIVIILMIVCFTMLKNKQKGSFNINKIAIPFKYDTEYDECYILLYRLNEIQNILTELNGKIINSITSTRNAVVSKTKEALSDVLNSALGDIYKIDQYISILNKVPHKLYDVYIIELQNAWNDYKNNLLEITDLYVSKEADLEIWNIKNKYNKIIARIDLIADLINRRNTNFINDLYNKSNDYVLEKTFAHYYPNRYKYMQ